MAGQIIRNIQHKVFTQLSSGKYKLQHKLCTINNIPVLGVNIQNEIIDKL